MRIIAKAFAAIIISGLLAFLTIHFGNDIFIRFECDKPSQSVGTPDHGRLVNGRRLPTRGSNFRTYSELGALLGRNSVHQRVRDCVVEAYASLNNIRPNLKFVYGETSWPGGGRFRPHKSHQNGLSVDFMVPIIDRGGNSIPLPTSISNKFGYAIEFDATGKSGEWLIDFEAMASHILALHQASVKHRLRIRRIIFTPELQPFLFSTETGKKIESLITFSKGKSWVRHDEHYHVDFELLE